MRDLTTVTEVSLRYHCPACGHATTALYANGDRQYGDLPKCKNKCDVPFAVMDAIANWLDDRAMEGDGEPTQPTRAHLCGADDR